MASEGFLSDRRVIVSSIGLIKSIIRKLDKDQGGLNGLQSVLDQFGPSDVIDKPESVLDGLILYLFCVHSIDWYSNTWAVKAGSKVTTRQGVRVFAGESKEQEVQGYLQKLRHRTQLFLQVLFCT